MTPAELIELELVEISAKLQNLVELAQNSGIKTQNPRLFNAVCDSSHYSSLALNYLDDGSDEGEPTEVVFNPFAPFSHLN